MTVPASPEQFNERVELLLRTHDARALAELYLNAQSRESMEMAGLQDTIRQQGYMLASLKGARTKKLKADELNRHVMAILRIWQGLLSPKASINVDGKTAEVARKAMTTFTSGTMSERRRLCIDAVRGLALRPYYSRMGRTANADAPGARKGIALRYALMDEEHIDEHAGFYRRAASKPHDWHATAWDAARSIEHRYMDLYVSGWHRIEREIRRGALQFCPDCNPDGEWRRDQASVAARVRCGTCAGHGVAAVVVLRPQLELVVDNTNREAA